MEHEKVGSLVPYWDFDSDRAKEEKKDILSSPMMVRLFALYLVFD